MPIRHSTLDQKQNAVEAFKLLEETIDDFPGEFPKTTSVNKTKLVSKIFNLLSIHSLIFFSGKMCTIFGRSKNIFLYKSLEKYRTIFRLLEKI